MAYHHLSNDERRMIAQLHALHASCEQIGRCLHRSPSTCSREIRRNRDGWGYAAGDAQRTAERRRAASKSKTAKMQRPELRTYVTLRLQKFWSPEQIAGRSERDFPKDARRRISRQTIYTFLRSDDHGRRWRKFLRRRPARKRPSQRPERQARNVRHRPDVINLRERYGDWEADTVRGPHARGAALVTLVERSSGYAEVVAVADGTSATVLAAIRRRMQIQPPDLRHSMTFDNGSEFARAAELTTSVGLAIYFADPGCPWQRGSNEHWNGLLRQFFPKGTSFNGLNKRKLAEVQRLLNDRPRKRLGYQTPAEIIAKHCRHALQT